MKITLICVGRLSQTYLREGVEEYAARIERYLPFRVVELKEEKSGGKDSPRVALDREGRRILERVPSGAFVILLDERGESLTSEELAAELGKHMVEGTGDLVFVIGGAYGVSGEVKQAANRRLSLSAMTFTHQMARLFLLEQLYRGFSILRNEPYHNR
ncbi:MAG: 23S rRNA (pseudouridine(1915)-N(3))-methyltransferase RlmH [Syntrophotaleaceae bacterium]